MAMHPLIEMLVQRRGHHMERVLDIGCGEGTSLQEELQERLAKSAPADLIKMFGVDFDVAALRRAKARYPSFCFVCARGEQLPFRAESFSTVVARVSLPYMDIPNALREVYRVLRIGGDVRMKLHPFSYTWSELIAELQSGPLRLRLQNAVYRLYVITNSLALHLGGVTFRFPVDRRRRESFQTKSAIRRILAATGFDDIDTSSWVTHIERPHAGNCWALALRRRSTE